MDRVEAGGFDNLALDASVFADGNVTLAMRQSLRLSGVLTLRADAPAASVVDLRAPYLLFNQSRYVGLQGADFFVQLGPEPLKYFHNGNRLNVSANLVDVRGLRDLIGFDDVRFDVQGDLRMGSPGFVDRSIRTSWRRPTA